MFGKRLINTGGSVCPSSEFDIFGDSSGVALYQLNSNADDSSGNYDGTATDVTYVSGHIDNAGSFNGSSSYIQNDSLANEIFKGYFTINLWANTPSSLPRKSIFHTQDDNNGHLPQASVAVENYNYNIEVRTNSSSKLTSTNIPITFGVWEMITLVLDSTGVKFYLNGIEQASALFTPVFTTNTSAPTSLAD